MKYIKIFSLKGKNEIDQLIARHQEAPHERLLQKTLAEEVTARVHGQDQLEVAIKASAILFGKSTTEDLESLDEKTLLQVFEGVPQTEISKASLDTDVTTFLSETTNNIVFKSKGEARKMIQQGAVRIDEQKVSDVALVIKAGTSHIYQVGKRRIARVQVN